MRMDPKMVGKVYALNDYRVIVDFWKKQTWQVSKGNKLIKKRTDFSNLNKMLAKARRFIIKHDGNLSQSGQNNLQLIGKLFKIKDYDAFITLKPNCSWRVLKNGEILNFKQNVDNFQIAVNEVREVILKEEEVHRRAG